MHTLIPAALTSLLCSSCLSHAPIRTTALADANGIEPTYITTPPIFTTPRSSTASTPLHFAARSPFTTPPSPAAPRLWTALPSAATTPAQNPLGILPHTAPQLALTPSLPSPPPEPWRPGQPAPVQLLPPWNLADPIPARLLEPWDPTLPRPIQQLAPAEPTLISPGLK